MEDRLDIDLAATFRLSWPGREAAPAPAAPARPVPVLSRLFGGMRRNRPAACLGWPVLLTAPGPEVVTPTPRVKLTGQPLD